MNGHFFQVLGADDQTSNFRDIDLPLETLLLEVVDVVRSDDQEPVLFESPHVHLDHLVTEDNRL